MNKLRIGLAVVAVLVGITGLSAVYTVNERETAVILEFGKFVHQEKTARLALQVAVYSERTVF